MSLHCQTLSSTPDSCKQGKETEHNWNRREKAILRVRGMIKGDVHLRYMDAFMACLKDSFIQWSLKTVRAFGDYSASVCSNLGLACQSSYNSCRQYLQSV